MSSARDPHPARPHDERLRDYASPADASQVYDERLSRLRQDMQQAAADHAASGSPVRGVLGRWRQQRDELEALKRSAARWETELEHLRREQDELSGAREEALERALEQREAELKALRGSAADRELALQREHAAELQRERERVRDLELRLAEAESGRDERREVREVKRQAHERERELRKAHSERLLELQREAGERLTALQEQREADNKTLAQDHATERARRQEELESLKLRREAEYRVYGERLEKLARESAGERVSLEESVAKLRERHESERARLEDRITGLEELLAEQESITVELLEELGYTRGAAERDDNGWPATELEVFQHEGGPAEGVRRALADLRRTAESGERLRAGLALFNETEHLKVIGAVCKSLGEPEVYAAVRPHSGEVESPVITFVWPGLGWRRYVSEPEESVAEPRVYLIGSGEDSEGVMPPGDSPNARLDADGRLALGLRPL